ncbi:hypothetical protein J6590_086031 [Homalodisca vitripennis]|nr:hypothetical protein J6590_086031 [Homalodisca vitripennis]
MDRPIRTMIFYSFPTTSMRQRGGMKLSEKQRYKNEDRRQRFQEQYLRQSSIQSDFIPFSIQSDFIPVITSSASPRQSMSDFYTITFTEKIESRKRLLHRSCRPRVYRFPDKS